MWSPWRRHPVSPLGLKIRRCLEKALGNQGHAKETIRQMSRGILKGDPFPPEVVEQAREDINGLFAAQLAAWKPKAPPLVHSISVKLLGIIMKALGDPDHDIMADYEAGVRLGVGTRLPRTPDVFPEKVKWNVPGQSSADPDAEITGPGVLITPLLWTTWPRLRLCSRIKLAGDR